MVVWLIQDRVNTVGFIGLPILIATLVTTTSVPCSLPVATSTSRILPYRLLEINVQLYLLLRLQTLDFVQYNFQCS